MRRFGWLAAAAAGWMALSGSASADTFPSKPITLIVPFGPGSGTDTVARLIGQQLSVALGQSVVVENKAGANGVLAATTVARATPDGYTLLVATNTTHSANPGGMTKNVPYDAVKDFAPVTRVGNYIFVLAVTPDVPAKSMPELIAHAKANPGKLTIASGNGTGIVAAESLKRAAGIDVLHVPYKSTPPAINDMLGGRISMMFVDLTASLSHLNAGTLRPLAVTTLERTRLLPELPSLNEAAVPNYDITSYCAIFAPAGTPKPIVDKLNRELAKIIDSPEIKKRLGDAGFEAFSSTPEQLGEFIQAQLVLWTRLIKEAGIEAQ
jgi:tripartite-type tricarboxylate transporter receptor subunit TctC